MFKIAFSAMLLHLLLCGTATAQTADNLSAVIAARSHRVESSPWWTAPFSVRSGQWRGTCPNEGADVLRGVSHAGWYGDWYETDPLVRSSLAAQLTLCGGMTDRRLLGYFDPGEMGEYIVLRDAQGQILSNAWSLGAVSSATIASQRLEPAWFGYPSFVLSRNKFANGRSFAPGGSLRADTGQPITSRGDFFNAVCTKDVAGKVDEEYEAPLAPNVFGASAGSFLRDVEGSAVPYLSGRPDVQGITGWGTVHLCTVDSASKLYLELLRSQIRTVYGSPTALNQSGTTAVLGRVLDGIHVDNVGDLPFRNERALGFGDSTMARFKARLISSPPIRLEFEHACNEALGSTNFDVASASVDDLRLCFGQLAHKHRPVRAEDWKSDFWLAFRPFRLLLMVQLNGSREYIHGLYSSLKDALSPTSPVTGNFIPLFPGGMEMAPGIDVPLFEWNAQGFGLITEPAGYANGLSFLARVSVKSGKADFSVSSFYVPRDLSESDPSASRETIERVHRALFYELLANRVILDSGHQYRGGYSPGTAATRRELNEFVSHHRQWLAHREMVADYGLVFSPESQMATVSFDRFHRQPHNDEYFAWANALSARNKQWDVVLHHELRTANLSRFKALVLPGVVALSNEDRQVLLSYIRNGGRVLTSGTNGHFLGSPSLFAAASADFDAELKKLPARVVACNGALARAACDADAMLRRADILDSIQSLEQTNDLRPGTRLRTFIRMSRSTVGKGRYFIDINRFAPLQSLEGEQSTNSEPIQFEAAVFESPSRCLAADSIDDGLAMANASTWGKVAEGAPGRVRITINAGALRYFRAIALQCS